MKLVIYLHVYKIGIFLHIKDAVRVARLLIEISICEGVYNFGDIGTYQLKHYIEVMKQVTVSKSILNYEAVPFNDTGKLGINPCVDKLVAVGW